jgi:hypothetical protein
MKKTNAQNRFSSSINRCALERPGVVEPGPDSEEQQIIGNKGLEHERAFPGSLSAQARSITDRSDAREHFEETLAAMRRQRDHLTFSFECEI